MESHQEKIIKLVHRHCIIMEDTSREKDIIDDVIISILERGSIPRNLSRIVDIIVQQHIDAIDNESRALVGYYYEEAIPRGLPVIKRTQVMRQPAIHASHDDAEPQDGLPCDD